MTRRSRLVFVRRRARPLLIWAGLAVSATFAYLAIRDVHWSDVWDALTTSDYWWLGPALLLLACANVVRALRWRSLFEEPTRPPFLPTLKAMLVGQFFNNVMPARAGEAVRIVVLHRDAGTSRAEAAGTVLTERVFDVLALLLLLFAALPWFPTVSWLRAAAILAAALAFGLVVAVALLLRFGERPLVVLARPLILLPFMSEDRLAYAATNLARGLAGIRDRRIALTAFWWTLLSWILIGLSDWVLMLGFDFNVPFGAGLLVAIATGLAWLIPSAPAAVGVFEAATLVALAAYGVPRSEALSYALVLHAMNFVPYVVAGVVVLRVDHLLRRH
jgi:glycosyltransferase 2 family protein